MTGLIAEGTDSLQTAATAWLAPLSGPPLDALKLEDIPGGLTLGRGDMAHLKLPLTAEKVSRAHCHFTQMNGVWSVSDSSRWGTFVNGVRLSPGQPVSLREGDTLRIIPWTFAFTLSTPSPRGQPLADDTAETTDIRAISDDSARQLAGNLTELLQQSTEYLHAAKTEQELAEALVDIAIRGTGLPNAALLKVVDATGRVEPLAVRQSAGSTGQQLYSRSLVARARQGQVAELRIDSMSGGGGGAIGESVMQMKISAAICAPLMIGDSGVAPNERDVAALLYLDARIGGGKPQPHAAGFALVLARIGSLALANLRRLEMAIRVKETEHELAAAGEAQRLIFPAREGRVGPFSYYGESKPGQSVGGDFFDVIPVGPRKLAVALGDVSGKGVPASVLMTASFGFLHSLLASGTPLDRAACMLTQFLHPRKHVSRFVTLWIGLFDLDAQTITYVDCGHGWAGLQTTDGKFQALSGGGGLPCGIIDDAEYSSVTIPLPPGGRAVIVSDGFVEQFGLTIDPITGKPIRDQFGMEGIAKSLARSTSTGAAAGGGDDLKALYDAVISFAGTPHLSDDATAILIKWD